MSEGNESTHDVNSIHTTEEEVVKSCENTIHV